MAVYFFYQQVLREKEVHYTNYNSFAIKTYENVLINFYFDALIYVPVF